MPSGSVYFSKNGARHRIRSTRSRHAAPKAFPELECLACAATGKCCANIRTDDLDLHAPKELLNLDVLHKRSTGRLIETIPYGRFGSSERAFFGDEAIKRSNHSLPSRLFLDPCCRLSKPKVAHGSA